MLQSNVSEMFTFNLEECDQNALSDCFILTSHKILSLFAKSVLLRSQLSPFDVTIPGDSYQSHS